MSDKEQILAGLAPLFATARAERRWFHCDYQNLWFSPNELARLQSEGRFVWGTGHWQLRDPLERLAQLKKAVEAAEQEFESFAAKVQAWKESTK